MFTLPPRTKPATAPNHDQHDMTTITETITICSEDGDRDYPSSIQIKLDGTQPNCPVTFWKDEVAVFSMAADEIPAFCSALSAMDCSA